MSDEAERKQSFVALWEERGRGLARRLLAARVGPFQLADLRYRSGVLLRHHGSVLVALGAARAVAEHAFHTGWDEIVDAVIRERTRAQRLPGEGGGAGEGDDMPAFLVTLGLDRSAGEKEVKRAYRERAHAAHPDVGGDHQLFLTLARARDEALAWIASRTSRTSRTFGSDGNNGN